MKDATITDREVYPAAWITLAVLGILYFLWCFVWGQPAFPPCWFYARLHVYCPACGGTRAMIALSQGHLLRALYYHPAVPFGSASVAAYLLFQTIWRIRGRRGWVLHYRNRWLWLLLLILGVNCIVRNILLLGFGIPI